MNPHFYNIQALRGIAVLLVIFYHLAGVQSKSSTAYALPDVLHFGAVGVDIFFLISGFLMMTITRGTQASFSTALQFMKRRLLRIYPIYWLVSIPITYLLFFSSRDLLNNLNLNPDAARYIPDLSIYLLKSALLFPQVNLPPLTISWTLIHEVYFYCVFGLLLLLPQRTHGWLLLAWSAVTLVFWWILKPTQYQPISYLLCNPLTLEFTVGCWLAMFLTKKKHITKPYIFLLLGCAAFAVSWLAWVANNGYEFPIADDRVLYLLLPCALILAAIASMEQQKQYLPQLLQKIGDASYSLYLTHIIFLSIGRKIWKLQGFEDSLFNNLWFWPSLFAVTLVAGTLCYQLLEKPLLRAGKKYLA
ncbi:MAG: acyltransferase [Cellvibrionales bacterium]|nr:acyltransferase [Cellvibrionales bacterium]